MTFHIFKTVFGVKVSAFPAAAKTVEDIDLGATFKLLFC